jgi:hypothetical protein
MNQLFSAHRVGLLIVKHWAENKKRYLLSVLALAGLLIAWFLFVMLTDMHNPMAHGMQQVTYFFSLFLVGTFYASQQFRELGSRPRASNFLLVPASAFEKLLCALFYTFIIFFFVFTAVFYMADVLMVGIANATASAPEERTTVTNIFSTGNVGGEWNRNLYFLVLFFALQAAFLLGSVYFEKYGYIKTSIALFVTFLLFFSLFYFFLEVLMPGKGSYSTSFMTSYRVQAENGEQRLVQLPQWIGEVLRILFLYAITPLLWLVTYYRLEEKEV